MAAIGHHTMCDARTPVYTCKVAKIYKLRIEHVEGNIGCLQTLFAMRLLGCKP